VNSNALSRKTILSPYVTYTHTERDDFTTQSICTRVTINNALHYWTNELYRSPNPNPSPLTTIDNGLIHNSVKVCHTHTHTQTDTHTVWLYYAKHSQYIVYKD